MFVPKHGNLGRTKAGWLHKVFATHVFLILEGTQVFPFVFPRIILFLVSCSKGGWLAPNPPPGSFCEHFPVPIFSCPVR